MKIKTTFYVLIVLSILSTLHPITSSAQDSDVYMYWADHGNGTNQIRRANLDGTNVQDIATGFGRPVGIALDMSGGKIYWTDRDNVDFANPNARNSIRRMNLDGTNTETLVTGGPSVKEAIALDTAGGKMYWVDWNTFTGAGKIQRANLDGTNVEDVVPELIDPRGIALDFSRGKMYWTDGGAGKIQRANFDGSNIENLVTGVVASYLVLDFRDSKIYWANWGVGKIQRANFDGSNVEDIVVGLGHATGIALDDLNGKIYWANWFTNFQGSKIQRANLDGSNVEDLVTGVGLSVGIALSIPQAPVFRLNPNVVTDQTFTVGTPVSLTLPTATGGTPPYTYNISALPPGLQFDPVDRWLNGTPTTLVNAHPVTYTATDATGADTSLTFTITVQDTPALTDVYMYWTDHGTNKIQRANLDGTNVQDIVTVDAADRIALDMTSGKIYWPNLFDNKIQRANLDGTNIEDIITTNQGRPTGIALDLASNKIYWSLDHKVKIQRANLDGTNIEDIIITEVQLLGDIALDVGAAKIYWTNHNTNKIQRANLDGSNIEAIITTGLIRPDGIDLDIAGGKIYWTEYGKAQGPAKIQKANLDGSNIEAIITTGLVGPDGIALDIAGGKIYWTDHGTDKIQRANLDGTNVQDLITTGLIAPVDIALGIPQTPGGLRFDPNVIDDQTFTVGTSVDLSLPTAMGGTPPYIYTLAPSLPAGLSFDPIANGPGAISGTPTAALPPTPFTYTATDISGASASLTFTITIELNLDVNADGTVDVLDLIWVAVSYQMHGDALPADVNADGIVNVQDLVAVANAIDAAAALPAKVAEEVALAAEAAALHGAPGAPRMAFNNPSAGVSGLTAHRNVDAALADVRALGTGDVRFGKWLPLFEELLQVMAELRAIPETTALLPNYPNPFNPETWIPYQLAQDANVTLTIYDVRGSVVRELVLGQQPAGIYETRHRAAYWNGRNQNGEPVASGLYFYTLTAGDFNATRRLLIAK